MPRQENQREKGEGHSTRRQSKHKRTFIQPEMFPRGIGDQIPSPAVSNLMRDYIDQRPVPSQQCRGHKGEAGVLHAPIGERGG